MTVEAGMAGFQEQINDLQLLINDLRVDAADEELQGRHYLAQAIRILSEAVIDLQQRVDILETKAAGVPTAREHKHGAQ
jgi:hypothetical protein